MALAKWQSDEKRSRQLAQMQKRSNIGFMLGLNNLWYKHKFKYHISDLDSEPGGGTNLCHEGECRYRYAVVQILLDALKDSANPTSALKPQPQATQSCRHVQLQTYRQAHLNFEMECQPGTLTSISHAVRATWL